MELFSFHGRNYCNAFIMGNFIMSEKSLTKALFLIET